MEGLSKRIYCLWWECGRDGFGMTVWKRLSKKKIIVSGRNVVGTDVV